jgi:hypothetical protein
MIALRDFYLHEGPATINQFIETRLPDRLRLVENDVRTFTVSLLLDTVSLLLERWASRTQNGQASPSNSELIASAESTDGRLSQNVPSSFGNGEGPSTTTAETAIPSSHFSPSLFENIEDLDLDSFVSNPVRTDTEDMIETNWILNRDFNTDVYDFNIG